MPERGIRPATPGKSICLVTTDFPGTGQSGEIGNYYDGLARLLSQDGWNVVVLFCGGKSRTASGYFDLYFKKYRVKVFNPDRLCDEGEEPISEIRRNTSSAQARSHIVHQALEVLIKKYDYRFDLIEFPEWNACGFIPVRMNKNFRVYEGSSLIIKLHGPSSRIREVKKQETATIEDLQLDYMEQYCFENADIQASSSEHLLRWCGKSGWNVRTDAVICPVDEGSPDKIASWYNERLSRPDVSSKYYAESESTAGPKVDVILPYYNTHQYVEKTLWSLYNQTYKNFRIILVNDGSNKPESLAMLGQIKTQYPDILVLNKANGGIGSARNYALPYIDAKYIVAVDADNIARPEMIETFVRGMENRSTASVLSCFNASFMDEDEKAVIESITLLQKFIPRGYARFIGPCLPLLFFENTQGDSNSIYRTEVIKSVGGWSENRHASEDWALWLKLIANAYKIDVIPQVLYYYRISPSQETHKHRLVDKDKNNLEYIRFLIEKRPGYFFLSCYVGLHRLVRSLEQQQRRERETPIGLVRRAIRFSKTHGFKATLGRTIRFLSKKKY